MTPRQLLIGIPVLFVLSQFLGPKKTNPPLDPLRGIEAQLNVTPEVSRIFKRACQNCHSHKTQWPWYSNVAPVSWFVIDNVNFARREMNLSDWAQYSQEEATHLLEEMCELVETAEMPLLPYRWMHDEAHLSEQDVSTLCEWTEAEQEHRTVDIQLNAQ